MNSKYFLNAVETAKYNNGEVATAVNMDNYKVVKVQQINGVMCQVISHNAPFVKVNPYINKPNELNLTMDETQRAMRGQSVIVYRSSGAKEGETTLTREEQIKRGVARTIEVCATLKEKAPKDSTNPLDYDWHILNDNSNTYEPLEK